MQNKYIQKIIQIVRHPRSSHYGVMSMAFLVVGLVAALGVSQIIGSQAATGGVLAITPASGNQTPGSTFTVAVTEASGTNPVNAVQASLTYNATQLQFVSISEGTTFTNVAATNTATAGVIQLARGTANGTTTTGTKTVVNITFRVAANASGSANIGFDATKSFIALASDGTNMLSTLTGATFTVASTGTMSLSPTTGSYAPNGTVVVTLNEDSGATAINAVQATIKYDSTKLQYVSIAEGTTFTNIAATNTATAGTVRLARGTAANTTTSGAKTVASITFRVLAAATAGTTPVTFDTTGSFIARASDASNILATTTPANYTVTAPTVNPAPTISAVSPTSGPMTGGTRVTITGTNFVSGATVKFGSLNGTSVTFNSATSITATAPAAPAGIVAVGVTNPDGQTATRASTYTYVPPSPVVSSVSPNSGSINGGTVITITGANFSASGSLVYVGGTAAKSITYVNSTTLTAVTPAHAAGTVSVEVAAQDMRLGSLANAFTYTGLLGDANNDGRVNAIDLSILLTHDNQNYPAADFNGDGTVGAADLAILLGRWTW